MPKTCPCERPFVFQRHLCSVRPLEVARAVAEAVDLSPRRASLALRTAWYPNEAPELVPFVDVDAWLPVAMGCLPTFAMSVPSLREIKRRAYRSMLIATLARTSNNLSEAARLLGHPRKVLREHLRDQGLYPIPDFAGELLTTRMVTRGGSPLTAYAEATVEGLHVLSPSADADDRVVLQAAAGIVERMGRGELPPEPTDEDRGEE